jgi:O-antigen/teichoic acid export membrane protein
MIIAISVVGLIISLAVVFLIKQVLIRNANDDSHLLSQYYNYLFPLVVFTLVFIMMDTFNTALLNATRGIFLKEFLQRLVILFSIVLYILTWVDFRQFIILFVLAVGIPGIILMINVFRHKDFVFQPTASPLMREKSKLMADVGLNGIFIGFSGMIILYVDRIMVERFLGLGPTGIYMTMSYFATLIAIPARALLKISDPIISQAWRNNDLKSIKDNYYRSSLNQFLIGSLIMIGIWGNIDNIVRMLPPAFAEGKFVILFLGFAFLADMVTGTATYILANSKYYRFQTYYIVILVVLIVITNLLLIPLLGLTGAAIATMSSKIIANLIRHLILYRKFRLQPYNQKFLLIIMIAGISYAVQYFLPDLPNLYLDIFVRSTVMSIIFIALALALRVSGEVNERFFWLLKKIKRRI